MSRTLRKVARRELRRSLGRFIALFLIVFLGAGFLAGLQSAAPGMMNTADEYFLEENLADFQLYCDMGITADDIAAVEDLPEVAQASGGYRIDVIASINDLIGIYALHSLPNDTAQRDSFSRLVLTKGRLPEKPDECVADDWSFIPIGSVITVTETNRETSLELLTSRTFTVVGLARSPLYVSTTRGNTDIGGGQIGSYLYIPEAAFESEYFTELNVRLTTTEGVSAFSEEYDTAVTKAATMLEDFILQRADERHQEIVEEAEAELNEAEDEYAQEKTRVETELADAKAGLEEGRDSLDEATTAYQRYYDELETARKKLEQGRIELSASLNELITQRTTLDASRMTLREAKDSLAELRQQNDALQVQLAATTDPLTIATLQAQIDMLLPQISALTEQVATGEGELAVGESLFASGEAAYAEAEATFKTAEREYTASENALWDLYYEIRAGITELEEGHENYNQYSEEATAALSDARAELDSNRDKLETLKPPTWIIQDREDLPGYPGFEADKNRIASLTLILPWFFFIVAAIVCFTTMTRIVEEHRTQIGTLKAVGYRRDQIARIYQSYAWMIGLSGGILGTICGILIFPQAVWNAYSTLYHMGELKLTIVLVPCLIGVFGGAVALSIATAFASRTTLNTDAAELMRPRPPRSGRRIVLERITFLWRRLSFSQKVAIRNLFRYKARSLVTIIGVAGCAALLVASLGLRDSITGVADLHYNGISHSQATIVFNTPTNAPEDRAVHETLKDYEYAYVRGEFISVNFGGRSNGEVTTYLCVPEDPVAFNDFITFRERVGHDPIAFPPDATVGPAVVITEQLANTLGVHVGDRIEFGPPNEPQAQARVAGITENYVYNYIYLTPAVYETLFGTPAEYTSAYFASDLPQDEFDALLTELIATEDVATALHASQLQTIVDQVVASINSVVSLMLASAFILAVTVLYNLISLTITERERELATLNVVGYQRWEIAAFISRETTALSIIGVFIGVFVGIWLHDFVMLSLEVNELMFSRIITPQSFVIGILFPLICNVLVNLCSRPRLNRLDSVEILKSVE
ncbi:MAG: FtsX-like permease family protein [Coriobacteriales bacterium]|jgi:putative ABC transport system permease protein|nr:FtsX-like permease family protein [Coriobacteriales bacterium]